MTRNRKQIIEERRKLKKQYGELFDLVTALLFKHDPVGINFEDNIDEYEPEAGTILPNLRSCHSVEEVQHMVHGEFVRWFDDGIAGPEENYRLIADEIWDLWQKYNNR
jgi:hypothetical protein